MNHEFLLGPEGQKRGFLLGDIIEQQKRGSDVLGGRRLTCRSRDSASQKKKKL